MIRGEFREDLYYRLNVVELHVPPLRERKEEIPLRVSGLLSRFNEQYGRTKQLSPETMARLTEYSWPGNIRELENVIRRLVVLTEAEQEFRALAARGQNGHAGPPQPAPVVTESLREIARRAGSRAQCPRGGARTRTPESNRGISRSQGQLLDPAGQHLGARAGALVAANVFIGRGPSPPRQ